MINIQLPIFKWCWACLSLPFSYQSLDIHLRYTSPNWAIGQHAWPHRWLWGSSQSCFWRRDNLWKTYGTTWDPNAGLVWWSILIWCICMCIYIYIKNGGFHWLRNKSKYLRFDGIWCFNSTNVWFNPRIQWNILIWWGIGLDNCDIVYRL